MESAPITPIQPDITIKTNSYEEVLVDWNPYCRKSSALFYQFHTGSEPVTLDVIPDCCVDILFRCGDSPIATVSGVSLQPGVVTLLPNTVYFGLKPFSVRGLRPLPIAWSETVNQHIDLTDIIGECSIVEDISFAKSFEQRVQVFLEFARSNLLNDGYSPDLVEHLEMLMCQAKGCIKIEHLSSTLGYTGRHCRARFKDGLGISIKSYDEVLRFQNSVRMLQNSHNLSFADIVFENNYYDQSHLIREFKRFANQTPAAFRKRFSRPGAC